MRTGWTDLENRPQLLISTGSILAHKEGRPGNSRYISALGYILSKVLIGG